MSEAMTREELQGEVAYCIDKTCTGGTEDDQVAAHWIVECFRRWLDAAEATVPDTTSGIAGRRKAASWLLVAEEDETKGQRLD